MMPRELGLRNHRRRHRKAAQMRVAPRQASSISSDHATACCNFPRTTPDHFLIGSPKGVVDTESRWGLCNRNYQRAGRWCPLRLYWLLRHALDACACRQKRAGIDWGCVFHLPMHLEWSETCCGSWMWVLGACRREWRPVSG